MADNKAGHNKQRNLGKECPHCGGVQATTFFVHRPVVKANGAIGQRRMKVHACSTSCLQAQVA